MLFCALKKLNCCWGHNCKFNWSVKFFKLSSKVVMEIDKAPTTMPFQLKVYYAPCGCSIFNGVDL